MCAAFLYRIAQIESEKRVVHSGQGDRPHIRVTRQLTQVFRVQALEHIGIAAEQFCDRGRVIR